MRDSVVRGIDRVDPFKDFHHGLLGRRTSAQMKVLPDYVPEAIIADYKEACLINPRYDDIAGKALKTATRSSLSAAEFEAQYYEQAAVA